MTQLEFFGITAAGSFLAGILGSLSGLGGGVVIVPLLALGLHVNIHYAVGASLIAVIGTSAGAQAAHGRESLSNLRIGLFLEIATTAGAIVGALLTGRVSTKWIAVIFGLVLLYSAVMSIREKTLHLEPADPKSLASRLRLVGEYAEDGANSAYAAHNIPLGFAMMVMAGLLSGLLGIGSGAVKVLAMDEAMKLPFKVSTATSNFMIGVTAAASAGIYFSRGYIDPRIVMPVVVSVMLGSLLGARLLVRVRTKVVRLVFAVVIAALGAEMMFNGFTGRLS